MNLPHCLASVPSARPPPAPQAPTTISTLPHPPLPQTPGDAEKASSCALCIFLSKVSIISDSSAEKINQINANVRRGHWNIMNPGPGWRTWWSPAFIATTQCLWLGGMEFSLFFLLLNMRILETCSDRNCARMKKDINGYYKIYFAIYYNDHAEIFLTQAETWQTE